MVRRITKTWFKEGDMEDWMDTSFRREFKLVSYLANTLDDTQGTKVMHTQFMVTLKFHGMLVVRL